MQNNKYYIAHASKLAEAQDLCIKILDKYMKGDVFNKVLIVGQQKNDAFEQLQSNLWNNPINIFPFILSNEALANISPLVCGYSLELINKPNVIIVYLHSVVELKWQHIESNKTIYIITLNASSIAAQKEVLTKLHMTEIPESAFLAVPPSRREHMNDPGKPIKINATNMNVNTTTPKREAKDFENALLVIKPSVMKRKLEFNLLQHLFTKTHARFVFGSTKKISIESWRLFYQEHEDKPWFESQCQFLSENYVMILVVSGRDAIARIRNEIGKPEPNDGMQFNSVRYIYGRSISDNGIHCSDALESYEREKAIVFPNSGTYDSRSKNKK